MRSSKLHIRTVPDILKHTVNILFLAKIILALLHRALELIASITNTCIQGSHSLYSVQQKNFRFKESS